MSGKGCGRALVATGFVYSLQIREGGRKAYSRSDTCYPGSRRNCVSEKNELQGWMRPREQPNLAFRNGVDILHFLVSGSRVSADASFALTGDFAQEPSAALCFIQPNLNHAGCSNVIVSFANLVHRTQKPR
jgi:hypothetical protein